MPPHGPGFSGALHSHDAEFPDDDWNLYSMIDLEGVKALNATIPEDAARIFKPFVHRLSDTNALQSMCDEEMIIQIPFTSPCHIRKLMFIGSGDDDQHPFTIKAFVNNTDIDFDNVSDIKPVQTFTNLALNKEGIQEELTSPTRAYNNCNILVLYITANHGSETTMIKYIGMQGEHTHYRREPVNAEYEVLCNGQDIEQPTEFKAKSNMGL
jgi:hypothetical protein